MADAVHDAERLAELQALPLDRKIQIAQTRIIEWYQHYNGNVVVSFSGGKDSTVLLHMVRKIYPDVRAVFSNTGLEYPEIQRFVKSFPNVDIVTPKMRFDEVITTYGYPLISKEVAEAIYYARRIRSQTVNVERERERAGARSCESAGSFLEDGTAEARRTRGNQTDWKRLEIGGGESKAYPDGNSAKSQDGSQRSDAVRRRTELRGGSSGNPRNGPQEERPGREAPENAKGIPTDHARGVRQSRDSWHSYEPGARDKWLLLGFRNAAGVAEPKSQFNKEKYLPLARDVPILISHYCCQKMKKQPMKAYQHKNGLYPYLGTLASESRIRKQGWIRHGCNAFDSKSPTSQPLSFWTEQDILAYIVYYGLEIAHVYGDIITVDEDGNQYNAREMIAPCGKLSCSGCDRTGCVFCGFGFHNERGVTRFQRLALTHPKQYEYCIGGGEWIPNPYYDPTAPEWDGEWKNWNPKQIWSCSSKGLGMGKVFDMVNEIYGKDFYRYE